MEVGLRVALHAHEAAGQHGTVAGIRDGDRESRTAAPPRGAECEVTGRRQADGFPERVLHWVARIPAGLTVYCGHDSRSPDGRPLTVRGAAGGAAVFLDTGAGKGGHLSWIDLPRES